MSGTHVQLLRVLAQRGVILLHKVPTNLILTEVGICSSSTSVFHGRRDSRSMIREGVMGRVAVGRHIGLSGRRFPFQQCSLYDAVGGRY